MLKRSFTTFGLVLASVALMGAGCAGGSGDSAKDAFRSAMNEANSNQSSTLKLSTPTPNSSFTVPLRVTGTGATAGMTVYAAVYNQKNELQVEAQVNADTSGAFDFSQIWMLDQQDPNVELRVYEKDASGKETNMLKVPLTVTK